MKKILIVFGTRPEAIKLAPVIKELSRFKNEIITKVCVTAQHRELLDQVLNFFQIEPHYDLDIMKPHQDLFDITARAILGVREVLREEKPQIVLVQGDTTTSFVTALASFYEGIPVGHVEAGLRTYNLKAPFPEEANRQLISRLSDLNFAPTKLNQKNLLEEGVSEKSIFITGNTVVDAILWTVKVIQSREQTYYYKFFGDAAKALQENKPIILVTGHRRESFGTGFERICRALKTIAARNQNVNLIYPVHPNPNVRTPVLNILGELKNVFLISPLEYEPFVFLMNRATLILTDSGGIQEEAPSLKKPLLVMRELTERQEALDAGVMVLVGTDEKKIVFETEKLLKDHKYYQTISNIENPFGDGKAAQRIVGIIKDYFNDRHC